EFVGDKGERDVVGPEKSPHRLEKRAAKTAMPGRITWKRRSEIRTGEITRGRAHWSEVCIAHRVRIAVAESGRSGAHIRFADSANRSPEIIIELRFPNRHSSVSHGGVGEREQSRELERAEMHLIGNVNDDLVVEPRRRAKTRGSVVSPENSDETLIGRARGGRVDT